MLTIGNKKSESIFSAAYVWNLFIKYNERVVTAIKKGITQNVITNNPLKSFT